MISLTGLGLSYGDQKLFEDVNIKFTPGHCYGIIGANGAGKTTLLKVLSGEIKPSQGEVSITPGERLGVLKQDHFEFDLFTVLDTVIMGHKKLYEMMKEKDVLYSKEDFSEEDGIYCANLEAEFAELDGWSAETNAEKLLIGLGIAKEFHLSEMSELMGDQKVKVLLAQSIFGNPDILLLDEPTNHLDFKAIKWLEEFLIDYPNIVIVVSHDRHFLNNVCTHMVDVDFGKAKLYLGNYDFWYESSQLALRLMKDQNKKKEEKIKELQAFIARFSSNASKAKQATSRKKLLDKISLDDIKPSTRRYPFVGFSPEREAGKDILFVDGISKFVEGVELLKDISFTINKGDKVIILGKNENAKTQLFKLLMQEEEMDEGVLKWGVTTKRSYLPKDHAEYFTEKGLNLIDWLRQYSEEKSESFIRGFLGKMLFSGEQALKEVSVLSGGEKVRCMFSKLMLSGANVMILDGPTNHLDLESIQAVNNGLESFKGTLLFTSHDYQFIQTIANRVIEITPRGIVDHIGTFESFLEDETLQAKLESMYS